jgi:hypothetical protein
VVFGSDHLTAYNVYAEAVNLHGQLGEVYGLSRHMFGEGIDEWATERGVLVKALEDIALGMASVYRTLELALPATLVRADRKTLRRFRDLVARVQPFDLVVDGETADGDRVRTSGSSVCNGRGIIAGSIRYFADRFGVARGALEGTDLPYEIVKKYVGHGEPRVVYHTGKGSRLMIVDESHYFGFVFDRSRRPLKGAFPEELAAKARRALSRALMDGTTDHPAQTRIGQTAFQLDELWRRSGGSLAVDPVTVEDRLMDQCADVTSYAAFLHTKIHLSVDEFVSEKERRELDRLPASVMILGDRVALRYEIEDGRGIALLSLREKQARRLHESMLPELGRPLRLTVRRGRREVVRVNDVAALRGAIERLPQRQKKGRRRRS